MGREACVAFLQWALPRLNLEWHGYRRVWRIAGKRLQRRCAALGLGDLAAYRAYLETHAEEWQSVDAACRIPISRFYRDRDVFATVESLVLPEVARGASSAARTSIACWSAGCASGEEAFSLALAWWRAASPEAQGLAFTVLGTDADPELLARARRGCYLASSLHELPESLRSAAFEPVGNELCLRGDVRQRVSFELRDLRSSLPDGPFDLILCRNVVLTYFAKPLQDAVVAAMVRRLRPGGYFIVGRNESPAPGSGLTSVARAVYRLPIS
jgi:chemotaxis protein methyltransferase CheR